MAIVVVDERLEELVDVNVKVEQIATGCVFTEGPIWHSKQRNLIFSDVRTGIMRRWTESGGVTVFRKPEQSHIGNGNTYTRDGVLLTCEHAGRQVSQTFPDGRYETLVDHYQPGVRLNSPNDVITAANGDVLFTDPFYGLRQPDGSIVGNEYPFPGVFRYTPSTKALKLLVDDCQAPNGLALTADERTMYICDTARQHIRAFDVADDFSLTNSRIFCEAKHGDESGRPDGMKLDVHGNVYLAANSPHGIWVFSPRGELLGFIGVGESPANLAWGEDDWQTMFVTAQTSVYRLRMKVAGQPVVLN